MSVFTPAGSGGLPPAPVVSTGPLSSPTTANVAIPLAATEVSYPLPPGTQAFYIRLRGYLADLQLAYTSGSSGTVYTTISRGTFFSMDGISPDASVTLYVQTTLASQVAEIMSWS